MNLALSGSEVAEKVRRHVQVWVDNGLCENCALILAAKDTGVDYGKVRALWAKRR